MAPFFELELDTTPPQIEWGTPSGYIGNDPLIVPYTLDEPEVLVATLTDANNDLWALDITAEDFKLNLDDVATGNARIDVAVRDEVWNEATYSFNVVISASFNVNYEERLRWLTILHEQLRWILGAGHGEGVRVSVSDREVD